MFISIYICEPQCIVVLYLRKSKPLTLDFQRSKEFYKSFHVRPELAKKSPLYEDYNRVQAWPAVNVLITGMADGSFLGGTKNKQLVEASSAHEVEILFRSGNDYKPCFFLKVLAKHPTIEVNSYSMWSHKHFRTECM